MSETETHVAAITHEIERVEKLAKPRIWATSVFIEGDPSPLRVPQRLAPAVLAALRRDSPGTSFSVNMASAEPSHGFMTNAYLSTLREALEKLSAR